MFFLLFFLFCAFSFNLCISMLFPFKQNLTLLSKSLYSLITFSIWMLWRIRNYTRFEDKIEVSKAISVVKDLTCLVGKSSKTSMKNDMMDFSVMVLILVLVKFLTLFLLDESFLHQTGLKLTLMGLLGIIQVLPLVEVFSMGV